MDQVEELGMHVYTLEAEKERLEQELADATAFNSLAMRKAVAGLCASSHVGAREFLKDIKREGEALGYDLLGEKK